MLRSVTSASGSNEARNKNAAGRLPSALRDCLVACLAGLCVSAQAQDAIRLRGTIDSVNGLQLRVSYFDDAVLQAPARISVLSKLVSVAVTVMTTKGVASAVCARMMPSRVPTRSMAA